MVGLLHIHSLFVVHSDIKMDNVLVFTGSGGQYVPKYADFGNSKLYEQWDRDMAFECSKLGRMFEQMISIARKCADNTGVDFTEMEGLITELKFNFDCPLDELLKQKNIRV